VDGNGKHQNTVLLKHTTHFAEHQSITLHVLDDIKGTDKIEFSIAEGQRANLARHGDSAARIQLLDRRWADADEMRAGNWQPGPKAWPEFQSRGRKRQQSGNQRPGVEAVGGLQAGLPPKSVVEGAIGRNDVP
jgi:hypothetical protein